VSLDNSRGSWKLHYVTWYVRYCRGQPPTAPDRMNAKTRGKMWQNSPPPQESTSPPARSIASHKGSADRTKSSAVAASTSSTARTSAAIWRRESAGRSASDSRSMVERYAVLPNPSSSGRFAFGPLWQMCGCAACRWSHLWTACAGRKSGPAASSAGPEDPVAGMALCGTSFGDVWPVVACLAFVRARWVRIVR
jgi:hypothetical protein